jgi:hypothetical protein
MKENKMYKTVVRFKPLMKLVIGSQRVVLKTENRPKSKNQIIKLLRKEKKITNSIIIEYFKTTKIKN